MVVYVDGKPIFVKNPVLNDTNQSNMINQDSSRNANKKPPAKIPYLLAVAAATAASNHREQQQIIAATKEDKEFLPYGHAASELRQDSESQRMKSRKRLHNQTSDSKEGSDMEQDYIQLVSMLKQKNQKLNNDLFK